MINHSIQKVIQKTQNYRPHFINNKIITLIKEMVHEKKKINKIWKYEKKNINFDYEKMAKNIDFEKLIF